jgi:nucleoside-diphosphate-sugar epimerase
LDHDVGDRRAVMGDTEGLHVVVGASGGTGSALLGELTRRGYRVRAVNRSGRVAAPGGVEVLAGDATDADRMREVCRGADVVYNAVNPPFHHWLEAFPAAVDGVLAGAEAADARMVFVDDTWMYGRLSGPMHESLPSRPVSSKGLLRAWLAEKVLAAHSTGRVRTVIGRAPELYGPAVESVLGRNLFGPALSGGTALWIGALDQPLTPMYIDDFAHGLVELSGRDEALGRVWHLPTAEPTTARGFLQLLFSQVGRPVQVRRIPERVVRALGVVWPVAREGAEMLYQFRQPHVIDATQYRTAIGHGQVTPYERGIEQTLEWYRRSPKGSLTALGR